MKVLMAYAMIPHGMHVPGTIPQHAMYAPHPAMYASHPAMPYASTANTGDCCKKLACLLDMIAQCGDPEMCKKALELCSGFQENCKLGYWQWSQKNGLSSSQMKRGGLGGSVSHLDRVEVDLVRDIPRDPENWKVFRLENKIIPEESAEKIENILTFAENLSRLKLTKLSLNDHVASILLYGVKNLTRLTRVSIADNEIKQLYFLASLPKSICDLNLSGNHQIDEEGIKDLARILQEERFPNLNVFNISGVKLEDKGISMLLEALTSCPRIQVLKFRDCGITDGRGLSKFANRCLSWYYLESVDFSENCMENIEFLLRGASFLTRLYLQNCELNNAKIEEMGEAFNKDRTSLYWKKLKKLDLSQNPNIGDEGFKEWQFRKIPNLKEFVIYGTDITTKTTERFKNKSLHVIDKAPTSILSS